MLTCLCACFPHFESLGEQEKQTLREATRAAVYRRGEVIHGHAGECTGAILIHRGRVRAYLLSAEGREVTLSRPEAGECCMLSALCARPALSFDIWLEAEVDTEVFVIDPATLNTLCEGSLALQNDLLAAVAARFSEVLNTLEGVLFKSPAARLASFLLQEAEKRGSLTLRLTQEQIARFVGSAREVISRTLREMSDKGLVEVGRGTVRLCDRAGLSLLTD